MERFSAALIKIYAVIFFFGVFLLDFHEVEALTCFDCNEVDCTQPVNCKGGFALGICGYMENCALHGLHHLQTKVVKFT